MTEEEEKKEKATSRLEEEEETASGVASNREMPSDSRSPSSLHHYSRRHLNFHPKMAKEEKKKEKAAHRLASNEEGEEKETVSGVPSNREMSSVCKVGAEAESNAWLEERTYLRYVESGDGSISAESAGPIDALPQEGRRRLSNPGGYPARGLVADDLSVERILDSIEPLPQEGRLPLSRSDSSSRRRLSTPGAYPPLSRSDSSSRRRLSTPGAYPVQGLIANHDLSLESGHENDREATAEAALTHNPPGSHPVTTETDLVTALLVESPDMNLMEAQPLDQSQQQSLRLSQQEPEEEREITRRQNMVLVCFTSACLILVLFLGSVFGRKEKTSLSEEAPSSPTFEKRPLPPMKNLEFLYKALPEKLKVNLYDISSPQRMAWEWLMSHWNISNMEEWQKIQRYAVAAIFYSMEGPNWPGSNSVRWLDQNTSECSWIGSDSEIEFIEQQNKAIFGPEGAYEYHACNQEGGLRVIGLLNLWFKSNITVEPSIAPEIMLLTSLEVFGIVSSPIEIELSNFLVPEIDQLPNLQQLNLVADGLRGTIPTKIAQLTALRHLVLPYNDLTGTLPAEIGRRMSSLEFLSVFDNQLTGPIPTELGLMTSSSRLELSANSLTGTIPTELGLLSNTLKLLLRNNQLTGTIPRELFLLPPSVTDIRLGDNLLSGSIPSEWWYLSDLELLHLNNLPDLHGTIPSDLMLPKLTSLRLSGSAKISGTLPEQMCFLGELEFDCTGLLCGCGCPCIGTSNETN